MITLALLLVAPIQTTWYVDQTATGPGTGTQSDPYTRVDFAVAQPGTATGDTVLVLPGTYSEEIIDFEGKDIILRSSGGADVTTLEAVLAPTPPEPVIRLTSGETSAATIEGFTLIAGDGDRPIGLGSRGGGIHCRNASVTLRSVEIASAAGYGAEVGGGIYLENGSIHLDQCALRGAGGQNLTIRGGGLFARNASITITDSTFTGCHANFGLGIFAEDSTLSVTRTTFEGNVASLAAGGAMALFNCQLSLSDCQIRNNHPGLEGAGIYAAEASQLTIQGSVFSGNRHGSDPYPGGALHMIGASRATIQDSQFVGNRGQYGGAIFGIVDIDGCLFDSNVATGHAQYGCQGGAISGSGTVRRSVFRSNTAVDFFSDGGGALHGSFAVRHCTFVDNEGAGDPSGAPVASVIGGTASLSNSIVRGGAMPRFSAASSAAYSNIEGGLAGAGNMDRPESFWPDLALLPDSPSIDAGNPASPSDPDGTRTDMGALPFDPLRCGAGCNGPLGSVTCTANANSTGQSAALSALGDAAAASDLVVLNVTSTPQGSLGFFLGSRTQGNQPLGGGSQGVLCLGGNVLRFSHSVLSDRGTNLVSFRLPLANFPQGNVVQAGETWFMQYWFRDANPQATSNTSSGLELTFQ